MNSFHKMFAKTSRGEYEGKAKHISETWNDNDMAIKYRQNKTGKQQFKNSIYWYRKQETEQYEHQHHNAYVTVNSEIVAMFLLLRLMPQ